MNKVFQGLYCDTTEGLIYNSTAISIGQANSAMIEGWLISSSLSAVATVKLQGSNDGQKWTTIQDISPSDVKVSLGNSAPDYKESSGQKCVIGFAQLRLTVVLTGSGKCVLDASIRTFQTA
jgi:hypothetical protein